MRDTAAATARAASVGVDRGSARGWDRGWLLAAAIFIASAVVSVAVMELPTNALADVVHYKYWAALVSTQGVAGAYSGTYPETAAIYPPVTMYGYRAAGWIYRRAFDPSFDMAAALQSRELTVLVKLVAVVPHLLAIPVIYGLLRRRFGSGPALAAAVAFGLNPAAIFDAAFWGQPDAIHAVLLLIAIYCFEEDRPNLGYVFVGLAMATKPQAWALAPFIAYVSLRRFGLRGTLVGGVVAGVVALLTCLPFLVYGTYWDLLKLPELIAVTMPVASANAHNVWWLVTWGKPDFVLDADPLLGPLTYRHVALALTLLVMAYGLWCTNSRGRNGHLSAMAAYLAFGWFLVTTRAHENHAFFALPLLVMAAPRSRFHWLMFAAVSTTLFLNMTIHDFGLEGLRASLAGPEFWLWVQLVNAAANVALFLIWSAHLWPRPEPRVSRRPGVSRSVSS